MPVGFCDQLQTKYEQFAERAERIDDLQTMLTFKTTQCRNPLHFQTQAFQPDRADSGASAQRLALSPEQILCRFYHGKQDRRRPILNTAAVLHAEQLTQRFGAKKNISSDSLGQPVAFQGDEAPSKGHERNAPTAKTAMQSQKNGKFSPTQTHFVLQLVLGSVDPDFVALMLTHGGTPCKEPHVNEKTADACWGAHNIFEQMYHPLEYLRSRCALEDHLVLYEEQSRLGRTDYRYEACPFFHDEKESRSVLAPIAQYQKPSFSVEPLQPSQPSHQNKARRQMVASSHFSQPTNLSQPQIQSQPAQGVFHSERSPSAVLAGHSQSVISQEIVTASPSVVKTELKPYDAKSDLEELAKMTNQLRVPKNEKLKIMTNIFDIGRHLILLEKQAHDKNIKFDFADLPEGQRSQILGQIEQQRAKIIDFQGPQKQNSPNQSLVAPEVQSQTKPFQNPPETSQSIFVQQPGASLPQQTLQNSTIAPISVAPPAFSPPLSKPFDPLASFPREARQSLFQAEPAPSSSIFTTGPMPSPTPVPIMTSPPQVGVPITTQQAAQDPFQPVNGPGRQQVVGVQDPTLFVPFKTSIQPSTAVGVQPQSSVVHLNLSSFKTHPCALKTQHNIKMCQQYHSLIDRRRLGVLYAADLCKKHKSKACKEGDRCGQAHSQLERLYHVEKYKTKFCSSKASQCAYAQFCSFAHSEVDIKTRLIEHYPRNPDFYMFYFKTEWCPYLNSTHNKAKCEYAHNWQDFRRKPHLFDYSALQLCQNWQAGTFIGNYHEGCPLQAFCAKSHGWKEQIYHPLMYKVYPCQQSKCDNDLSCGYYHANMNDRRYVNDQSAVFDVRSMRAFPLLYLTEGELTRDINEVVLDNPNHVKEYLFNCGLSALQRDELVTVLQSKGKFKPDEVASLCERGCVQNATLDDLRRQFQQAPHVPLVGFNEPPQSRIFQGPNEDGVASNALSAASNGAGPKSNTRPLQPSSSAATAQVDYIIPHLSQDGFQPALFNNQ